jgi:hypothetical protein
VIEPVMVRVSPELVAPLMAGWSLPCQVMIERRQDGTFEMIARTHNCPSTEAFGRNPL